MKKPPTANWWPNKNYLKVQMNIQKMWEQIQIYLIVSIMALPWIILIGFMVKIYLDNWELIWSYDENIRMVMLLILLFLLQNPIWVIIIIGTIFLYKYTKKHKTQKIYIEDDYNY